MTYHPDFHSPTYSYEAPGAGHRNPQEILNEIRNLRQYHLNDERIAKLTREFLDSFDAHEMVLYQP